MLFGKGQFEIGKIWGVPIRLDTSLIFFAIIYFFRYGFLYGSIIGSLLLLSVLLHELGHTAVALSFGCRVRDITLLLIGGRATLLDLPRKPWKEAWMAFAGPLVSLILALVAFLLPIFTQVTNSMTRHIFGPTPRELLQFSLVTLFYINSSLFLFNLLPAFPMDGGRIFRALLSSKLGRRKATFIAYRTAQIVACGMAIWAIVNGFDIFLMLIAYFVFTSSKMEYAAVLAENGGGYDPFDDNSVVISPPPYGGRNEITDVFKDNEKRRR